MGINRELLLEKAKENGILLDGNSLDRFDEYSRFLIEYNDKVNLTAITDPEEIAIKHFLDSIMLTKAIEIKKNATLVDVGTGAGFPSVPVKIIREDIDITLMDALNKRLIFLDELCSRLKLNARTVHIRAEQAGADKLYREKFDVATARAVAALPVLCEYCLPLVKVGGYFIAMKGYEIEEELESSKTAIGVLGARFESVSKFILPDSSKRSIIIIKKISQTPTKYPRQTAKIAKQSL